jgi:ATP-dependent protease HslVU (ClpYQ) peptidase subunit
LRLSPTLFTVFQVKIRGLTADLTQKPFVETAKIWQHKSDYQKTHEFAVVTSKAKVSLIRYKSVSDPKHGACLAVLSAAGFGSRNPLANSQSWVLSVSGARALWVNGEETIEFQTDFWN